MVGMTSNDRVPLFRCRVGGVTIVIASLLILILFVLLLILTGHWFVLLSLAIALALGLRSIPRPLRTFRGIDAYDKELAVVSWFRPDKRYDYACLVSVAYHHSGSNYSERLVFSIKSEGVLSRYPVSVISRERTRAFGGVPSVERNPHRELP